MMPRPANQNMFLSDEDEASMELSPTSFASFAQFITSELGIKMPDSKLEMVRSRLLRRVRDLQMASVEEYAQYFFASSNGEEREHLINVITTNKTDFFRESTHFEYLVEVALPALSQARMRSGERVKLWSAGCSSGEEPYTLAMVMADYAGAHPGLDFAILGTDISTKVLNRARAGIYQDSQAAAIPPEYRRRYLLRSQNRNEKLVRVTPQLRAKVNFHQLNFMDEDYRIRDLFDAIFFRNVMIYFDRETTEAVVRKLCQNLLPGGYFFVGHSESIGGLNVPVKCVKTSIYRKFEVKNQGSGD
jgi:chemotaxis protein methyltransferase CheR